MSEWHELRKSGLGGSDIAAVMGLLPWKSPLDVWGDKTRRSPDVVPTKPMRWGAKLEEVVAQEYSEVTGRTVHRVNAILRHPSLPLLGNIDRAVAAEGKKKGVAFGRFFSDRILECKTARSDWGWGEPGTDEIPIYYVPQTQHYLGLTGVEFCDVAVLIAGSDFRIYTIKRDEELIESMWATCAQWWQDYVVADVPPPPRSADEVKQLWPSHSPGAVVLASTEIEAAVTGLLAVKGEIRNLKAKEKDLADMVTIAIGSAESLIRPDGKVLATYKASKPSIDIDWQAVIDHAKVPDEVVRMFSKETAGTRRLNLNKI